MMPLTLNTWDTEESAGEDLSDNYQWKLANDIKIQ